MTTATTLRPAPLDIAMPNRTKALVYNGPGKRAWDDRPTPGIQAATDAIVRTTTSTICGTDLHILKDEVPSVVPGRILGQEGAGVVQAVGAAVRAFAPATG